MNGEAEMIRKNVTLSQEAVEQGEALARLRTRGNFSLMIEQLIEAEAVRTGKKESEVAA